MVAPTHATGKNAPLSAPTDLVFDIGLAGFVRYNKKRVCDILDATDSWCAVQDSNL